MQEALQQRIEEKEKALRIAHKVARETAERRDKQNVRGEKNHIKREFLVLCSMRFKENQKRVPANLTAPIRRKPRS